MQRRNFLKKTLVTTLGIGFLSSSCDPDPKKGNNERDSLIRQLQAEAKSLEGQGILSYVPNNGFVYSVSVWGDEVVVNLGKDGFHTYGNNLKYSAGDTTVRGYMGRKLRIWEKGTEISPLSEKILLKEQQRIDLVLQQICEKHLGLRKQGSAVLSYTPK